MKDDYAYGLLLIEAQVATYGLLGTNGIVLIEDDYSIVPSKHSKGGQSSVRYDRVRENLLHDFFKKINEKARELFSKQANYKGLIVGGAGHTKEEFLRHFPQPRLLGVIDVGDTGQSGLRELVNRSTDLLKNEVQTKEKTLLQEFFGRLGRGDSKVVYGKSEVKKAYEEGRLTHLIVSENEGEIEEQGALRVSATTEEGTMFSGLGGWAGYLKY